MAQEEEGDLGRTITVDFSPRQTSVMPCNVFDRRPLQAWKYITRAREGRGLPRQLGERGLMKSKKERSRSRESVEESDWDGESV